MSPNLIQTARQDPMQIKKLILEIGNNIPGGMKVFVTATFVNASQYPMLIHDDGARRRDDPADVLGPDRSGANLFQMAGYRRRGNDEYGQQGRLWQSIRGPQPIVSAATLGKAMSVAYDP